MDKVDELLTRGVANIIPNKAVLEKALRSNKKLNIYLGIDPTATQIHLGHGVSLRKLQAFAELGHNVTFLIGDFTALIGDTSDKDSERPVLTKEEIEINFRNYKKQAEKILDFSKVKVHYNSEWLGKLTFEEIIKVCQHFSFGEFASRELIKKRLADGKHVGLHEALYPVMQGYDSYYIDTDVQVGGTDQTFNMQAGRTLQKDLRGKESFVLATEFLMGTDGRKMSKTWGNAIWLTDEPNEMFGKVMSIDDSVIIQYLTLGTNMPLVEIEKLSQRLTSGENPIQIKKVLARKIVMELYNGADAQAAQEEFERTFQENETPTNIPSIAISFGDVDLVTLLVENNVVKSRAEAKRLIEQKALEVNGEVITDTILQLERGKEIILKVGKRRFLRIATK